MKKQWLAPLLAVAGGAVGFGLRKWQLSTGFEPDTGLAIPGSPAALALIAWSAVVVVGLIALCWDRKGPRTCQKAFRAEGKSLFLTACVLGAFLLLVSAGAEGITLTAGYQSSLYTDNTWAAQVSSKLLPPLRVALCLGGFPCALLWVKQLSRKEGPGRESLAILEVCILFCAWLVSDYQVRAADPVILDYVYEVLAIAAALMALYYIAGYSFQTGKPRRTAVTSLMAAYFALVTLADDHDLADAARFGFVVLFMTAHAALLLSGPNEIEPEAEKKEDGDESKEEEESEETQKEAEENA